MSNNDNSIYSKPIIFTIMVLVVILIGSIVTAFYPLVRSEMHAKLDNLNPYTALQLAGRDVYQKEGCTNCHTQVVRPLKGDVLRYGDYSKAGENAYERPFLWGSRRTGPDLARIGGKYPDEWHVAHFVKPQDFQPMSNMPAYPWLANKKIDVKGTESNMKSLGYPYTAEDIAALSSATELDAMVAYMQVLGTSVERFQLVMLTEEEFAKTGNPMKGKPQAIAKGQMLFKAECLPCHNDTIASNMDTYGDSIDEATAFLTIANGMEGSMPGFLNVMTREQIGSLVEYLASNKSK